jgi:hypothetical protein
LPFDTTVGGAGFVCRLKGLSQPSTIGCVESSSAGFGQRCSIREVLGLRWVAKPRAECHNPPIEFGIELSNFNSAVPLNWQHRFTEVRLCHDCLTASQFAATIAVLAGTAIELM